MNRLHAYLPRLKSLCRGRPEAAEWLEEEGWLLFCVLWLFGGLFLYGFAIGWWRAPLQGLYGAVKTPVLMAVTISGTTLANWMLASLLGAGLTFRQALLTQLMGYVVLVTILLSVVPLAFFLDGCAPSSTGRDAWTGYVAVSLFQVLAIAGAGLASHVRLFHLILHVCRNRSVARWVLLAWMANNLFLGSHFSWYLRPFMGNPAKPVEFFHDRVWALGGFYSGLTGAISRLGH
jgi:hypothetical protein